VRSAIERPHLPFGIARPDRHAAWRDLVETLEIIGGRLDLSGPRIFLQIFPSLDSGDRYDVLPRATTQASASWEAAMPFSFAMACTRVTSVRFFAKLSP
jgi:hypothetical protein